MVIQRGVDPPRKEPINAPYIIAPFYKKVKSFCQFFIKLRRFFEGNAPLSAFSRKFLHFYAGKSATFANKGTPHKPILPSVCHPDPTSPLAK
jgi:hypothetical protein